VLVLNEGSSFGELALVNDRPRSATIKCLEDCHFGILLKQDFKMILQKSEEEKFMKQVGFFRKLPFLCFWGFFDVKTLYYKCTRAHLK
jgi:CRP-like cAMP-binding protein